MQIERAACLQALEMEGNGDEADFWGLFPAQVDSSFKEYKYYTFHAFRS